MSTVKQTTATHFLREMYTLNDVETARVSSWDRTGANRDWICPNAGETAVLADIAGPGCIRHIYFTISGLSRFFLREMILRMYWDDEKTPSVEVPLGDLFGLGFCVPRYYRSLPVTVNQGADPDGTIGLNCYFPMPFAKRALLTLENDSEVASGLVWYHVDYETGVDVPGNVGRFHAQWRRENPCTAVRLPEAQNLDGKENYVILEAEGRGNYVGMFLNVDNICGGWYGEGDDMIFIDGEQWPPSFHGTGTEEIFGGGACPNTEYAGPYTGFHLVSSRDFAGKQSMYRFHVADPVRFQKSIRVTLEHGHANDLSNDYSSTAFWYQAEPHAPFPKLPPRAARVPRWDERYLEYHTQVAAIWSERADAAALTALLATPSPEEQAELGLRWRTANDLSDRGDYEGALSEWKALRDSARKRRGTR